MSQKLSAELGRVVQLLRNFIELLLDNGSALQEILGPLKSLFERLDGKNGNHWLTSLKMFLRNEDPFPKSLQPDFTKVEVFTLTVGDLNKEQLLEAFASAGMRCTDDALQEMGLSNLYRGEEKHQVTFVKGCVLDLFKTSELWDFSPFSSDFVNLFGLELCSFGDAFLLRLRDKDQPERNFVNIGMSPCQYREGEGCFFFSYGHQIVDELWDGTKILKSSGRGKKDLYIDIRNIQPLNRFGPDVEFIYRLKEPPREIVQAK